MFFFLYKKYRKQVVTGCRLPKLDSSAHYLKYLTMFGNRVQFQEQVGGQTLFAKMAVVYYSYAIKDAFPRSGDISHGKRFVKVFKYNARATGGGLAYK